MTEKIRVVHYLNQFFAQVGGEEKADIGPGFKEGPTGPGRALQQALAGHGEVVATLFCGDNYFAEHAEEATEELLRQMTRCKPHLLIAGPAFESGRYGVACGAICQAAQERLEIHAVAGMDEENAGAALYCKHVYIINSGDSIVRMLPALQRMVALGIKLVQGAPLGRPEEEGYIPRGIKRNAFAAKPPAERAVDMLSGKNSRRAVRIGDCCAAISSHQTGNRASRLVLGGYRVSHRRWACARGQPGAHGTGPSHSLHYDPSRRLRPVGPKEIRRRSFRLRHRFRQSRSAPTRAPRRYA